MGSVYYLLQECLCLPTAAGPRDLQGQETYKDIYRYAPVANPIPVVVYTHNDLEPATSSRSRQLHDV